MCIIIYKPKDARLGKQWEKQVRFCYAKNKDGCGIMVKEDSGIYMRKGMWDVEEMVKIVKNLPKKSELAIHFRWTSAGNTVDRKCHPFALEKGKIEMKKGRARAALMHNGTIRNLCFKGEASDTYHLARLLSKFHPREIEQKRMMEMVEGIASGSRVLIFTEKQTLMWGEWHEYEGCFFSNSGYRKNVTVSKSDVKKGEFGDYYLEFDPKSNSYVRRTGYFF